MTGKCTTDAHEVLFWSGTTGGTQSLFPSTTKQLARGYASYNVFCNEAEITVHKEDKTPLVADAAYISDDDVDHLHQLPDATRFTIGKQLLTDDGDAIDWCKPVTTDFYLDGPSPDVISDEEY